VGSGTSVQEVNRLLKQYEQMQKMMRTLGKRRHPGGMKLPLGM
jgi:signal recognition particle subunit SRP54